MRNLIVLLCALLGVTAAIDTSSVLSYGPSDDASWAIQSRRVSNLLSSNKQSIYDNHIKECNLAAMEDQKQAGGKLDRRFCSFNDGIRMRMNRNQPSSVYNYTAMGFEKIRAPSKLFETIRDFYYENKDKRSQEWSSINTYQNLWDIPSTIVRLEDDRLTGGGEKIKAQVWEEAQKLLEAWTGQHLRAVSLYGVREYHRGSILAPHVDRMPLITSAIINVDQQGMDEPWVLEVYGHDGKATNVTMEPGDMVLYESHSVIHGRPFPLQGEMYANLFLHFEPSDTSNYDPKVGLPPYIVPGSNWEYFWRADHPNGWMEVEPEESPAREAVFNGDVELLRQLGKDDPEKLHLPDVNGWHPLHEAVRAGNIEMVRVLLDLGASVNQPTYYQQSPLSLARENLGEGHEMIALLLKTGATDAEPDL